MLKEKTFTEEIAKYGCFYSSSFDQALGVSVDELIKAAASTTMLVRKLPIEHIYSRAKLASWHFHVNKNHIEYMSNYKYPSDSLPPKAIAQVLKNLLKQLPVEMQKDCYYGRIDLSDDVGACTDSSKTRVIYKAPFLFHQDGGEGTLIDFLYFHLLNVSGTTMHNVSLGRAIVDEKTAQMYTTGHTPLEPLDTKEMISLPSISNTGYAIWQKSKDKDGCVWVHQMDGFVAEQPYAQRLKLRIWLNMGQRPVCSISKPLKITESLEVEDSTSFVYGSVVP